MNPIVTVVPCYNEAERLDAEAFARTMTDHERLHLLFVDDGSRDDTPAVLAALVKRLGRDRAKTITLSSNAGKAEAVRAGVQAVLTNYEAGRAPFAVGYWDADLSTPLDHALEFARVLEERSETFAVIGSRVRLMGRAIERRALRHYSGRVFATLASLVLGFPVYDTQCGAKLFRATDELRLIFEDPFASGWAFDVEILARLASTHGRDLGSRGIVVEFPLTVWSDVGGSKVSPSDLPRMLFDLASIHRRYRGARGN